MASVWDKVIGQEPAVARLRRSSRTPVHAYLLVGAEGCGKDDAARAFAAELLAGTDDDSERICRLVMSGTYVDVHEIRREGASISKDLAEEIIRLASTTGAESRSKVIIVHEVHTMRDDAAARLLKTVEEPAAGIVMVLLADQLVPSLTTIASRCVQVSFAALGEGAVRDQLVREGVETARAQDAARLSHGSIDRARLLAADPRLVERYRAFAEVPSRLDGTGATVLALVENLLALIDDAATPLAARHEAEVAEHDAQLAASGQKKGGRKALEERHKRELRRHRTDELRSGLAGIAAVYRDQMADDPELLRPQVSFDAVSTIHDAIGRLSLNVREDLLLRDLLWRLPSLSAQRTLLLEGVAR